MKIKDLIIHLQSLPAGFEEYHIGLRRDIENDLTDRKEVILGKLTDNENGRGATSFRAKEGSHLPDDEHTFYFLNVNVKDNNYFYHGKTFLEQQVEIDNILKNIEY